MIVGGSASSLTGAPLATAELYNPNSETFSAIGNTNTAHASHTATLLADGKVVVAGGSNLPPNTRNSITVVAELYDPATNTFAHTGAMQAPREFHQAVRLANGEVLVAGGDDGVNVLSSTEVYDPTIGTFATDARWKCPTITLPLRYSTMATSWWQVD